MYTFQSYYASEQFCAPFGEIGGGCIKALLLAVNEESAIYSKVFRRNDLAS